MMLKKKANLKTGLILASVVAGVFCRLHGQDGRAGQISHEPARENVRMVGKLAVVAAGMFAFGYALVPIYKAICEMTGINILALGERNLSGAPTKACRPTRRWMHFAQHHGRV
jgi:hypothetical protein